MDRQLKKFSLHFLIKSNYNVFASFVLHRFVIPEIREKSKNSCDHLDSLYTYIRRHRHTKTKI